MKLLVYKSLCFLLMIIGFMNHKACSQVKSTEPMAFTEKELVSWDYSSKEVGEDYTLYIHFPPGYDTTKTNYPVLYMTDGDWNMTVAMNCFRMLRQDYTTREPLIVGIGYGSRPNQRSRDLNPGTGGPKFLAFIQQEVMPFIQSKYRVTNEKGLYGYSMGGMFTTYVLFEHPDLFNEIYIGAPANNGLDLMVEASKYFANHQDLKCKVFLGVGSFEHDTEKNIRLFKKYMDQKNCKSLVLSTAITPNAGHGASLAAVMQNGMAFVYCEKHAPIVVSKANLQKYTGQYGAPAKPLKVYANSDGLYFKEGEDDIPTHLVPFEKGGFFIAENERLNLYFKEEGGKKYLVVSSPGEKQTRLEKIK